MVQPAPERPPGRAFWQELVHDREPELRWMPPHMREMALFHCLDTCRGKIVVPWKGGTSIIQNCDCPEGKHEAPTSSVTWVLFP